MQKWEYKTITTDHRKDEVFDKLLNELGNEGWEMICAIDNTLYFKREVRNVSKMRIRRFDKDGREISL